jgi:hypothetical protein
MTSASVIAFFAFVIPLAAFVILAVVFVVVLRRASRALRKTREAELFREAVDDLAGRIDRSLGAVIERIDATRRHQVEAAAIGENVEAASDAVRLYAEEAAVLDGPVPAHEVRANLLAELDRAGRALAMVAHGCALLDLSAGRHRELEAQTAIKRGYLNAVHAREAIARHAADLASGRSADQRRWLSRRSG